MAKKCVACNGSGWYDNCDYNGNAIPCDACDGTGYEPNTVFDAIKGYDLNTLAIYLHSFQCENYTV